MKRFLLMLSILTAIACSKPSPPATTETTYPMTATIVSRDPVKNMLNLDNKEVPGKMAAMKMDYELHGAKVSDMPPDGTPVEVTVHDVNGSYYVTGVKSKK